MASDLVTLLASMRSNPQNVRFSDACRVADHYFGQPRHKGSSHHVWKMPWPGDPRVNMQNDGGNAKRYQVEQLLAAIDHLESQQSKPDAFASTPGAQTKSRKKKGMRP
jgi:hypothetical protein